MTHRISRRTLIASGAAVLLLSGCTIQDPPRPTVSGRASNASDFPNETWRPQYHYTAVNNQINDPNGLLWYDGEFHLFHQYNVHGAVHWGHAVSTDLLHWKHLAPALYPDSIGQIWSGSAVVDTANTSGLRSGKEDVFVALFTYSEHDGTQSQGLAFSNDRGRTWTKHPHNPILPNPGLKDFRDPKVFWHQKTRRWIMILSTGTEVAFYSSVDLHAWTPVGTFGSGHGAHGGAWECPDLFELRIGGSMKWVLSISVVEGGPAGGSGMQYFVGDFDGTTFVNANSPETVLWQSWGKDFYAGVTWGDHPFPDSRRLMIAWTDNWQYREVVPTVPFNGQLSLIRELTLRETADGIRLVQQPIDEYKRVRRLAGSWESVTVDQGSKPLSVHGDCLEVEVSFDAASAQSSEFGIDVRVGPNQKTRVGYDMKTGSAFIDRTMSGTVPRRDGQPIGDQWQNRYLAPVAAGADGSISLRIFVDRSSVEVFVNDREQLSCLILPDRDSVGLVPYSVDGPVTVSALTVYAMERTVEA